MQPGRSLAIALGLGLLGAVPAPAAAGPPRRGAAPSEVAPGPTESARVLVFPAREGLDTRPAEAAVEERGFELASFEPVEAQFEASAQNLRVDNEARIRRLEQSLAAARGHYLEQDFAAMRTVLEPALIEAGPALAGTPQCAALWEVEFQLGLAVLSVGGAEGEAQAQLHFEAAMAIDDARRPEPALYGPAVTTAFLRAVDARGRRVARKVEVRRRPESALVWIDCAAVEGDSASVRPGRHLVVGKAVGHRAASRVEDVDAGPIEVELAPAPRASASFDAVWRLGADPENPEVRAAVWSAAAAEEVDAVLWVDQVGADAVARVVLRDELTRPSFAASQSEAASRALARLGSDGRLHRLGPGEVAPGRSDAPGPEGPVLGPGGDGPVAVDEARRRRRRLGIGLGVGGAAALALALGLGLGLGLSEPPPPRLQVTVQ